VKDSANVNVSDRAQMMQKAKDIASQPETIDEAKVARLQKLIDEGKYNVDAASIADRLVDEHMTIPD
jgi:flagellar biosynthesis anti-sigma factor FlgM